MTLTFIHTSDWHLGRRCDRIGPNSAASRAWRFDAVRRVFDLAIRERAAFILGVGDIFQSATQHPSVVDEAVALLRDAPAPTILIPGNHDPLVEGSVWNRGDFRDRLACLPNVVLALTCEPIVLSSVQTLIFPCPVTSKHAPEDVSAWIPQARRGGEQFRIGLAHGGLQGYNGREYHENVIAANRAEIAGLDYLALGDFHSFTLPDHPAAALRTWYSGTSECTAVDESRAGHALVVRIASPGETPVVTPQRVGRMRPVELDETIFSPGSGFDDLKQRVESIENREDVLLGLRVAGALSAVEMPVFDDWANGLLAVFLGVDLDRGDLCVEPTDADFADLGLDASESRVVELLRRSPPDELSAEAELADLYRALGSRHDVCREATALYYRYLKSEA